MVINDCRAGSAGWPLSKDSGPVKVNPPEAPEPVAKRPKVAAVTMGMGSRGPFALPPRPVGPVTQPHAAPPAATPQAGNSPFDLFGLGSSGQSLAFEMCAGFASGIHNSAKGPKDVLEVLDVEDSAPPVPQPEPHRPIYKQVPFSAITFVSSDKEAAGSSSCPAAPVAEDLHASSVPSEWDTYRQKRLEKTAKLIAAGRVCKCAKAVDGVRGGTWRCTQCQLVFHLTLRHLKCNTN